jgi:uncharacterized protein YhaN
MSGLRLEQLRLEPWGCFEDLRLDFGGPGTLDLVLGPNAAGKSTMTRGVAGLLFGIEQRSRDNHTFDYADLRLGARLATKGGHLDVVRRKGRTGTLLDAAGETLSDDYLDTALGGLGREIFESLLLVDNTALKDGGAELLQGKGEVGASLFAAAAGIANLHETIERLDSTAKDLFNPRGRMDAVHDALRELKEAEKRLREATLRPQKHKEMEREVGSLKRKSEEIAEKIRGLTIERAELDRRRRVAPMVRRHGELVERLDALTGTPNLPDDARERRVSAENDLRSARAALKRAQGKRDALARQIEESQIDEDLIARSEEIEAVVSSSSAVLKGAEDRPRLAREAIEATEKVRAAAEAAGVEPKGIEELRRPPAVQGRLDDAVSEYGTLVERRRARVEADVLAGKAFADAELKLAETPPARDPSALLAAVKAGRALGPIDRQLGEARVEAGRLREAAELALARLSPRPASLPELAELAVPASGVVEAALERAAAREQEERDLGAEEERVQRQILELGTREDELEIGRAVPGPKVLIEARADREELWRSVRDCAEAGTAPSADQMDVYEERVSSADAIVDEQLAGSVELERMARLELDRRTLERERKGLSEKRQESEAARIEEAEAWEAIWSEVGCNAPKPEAATEWLKDREEVLSLLDSCLSEEAKARALNELMAEHRASVIEHLGPFGVEPGGVAFAELLEIAEAEAARAASMRRAHEEAENAVAEARRLQQQANKDASEAEAALSVWAEGWPEILDAVGLPAQTTPEVARTISRSVGEGLDHLRRLQELKRRIAGIDRDQSDYAEAVAALVIDLTESLEGVDPTKAAALLGARLAQSQEAAAARTALIGQRTSLDEEVESAEGAVLAAEQAIEAVLAAAGCEDFELLPRLEERSAEAKLLQRDVADLEGQAVEAGERRFDELSAEVEDLKPALAAARLEEIDRIVEDLGSRRDELRQEVGAKESELRMSELNTEAVTAREDIELIKGKVRALVRRYAAAKLGSMVVRRAMERYRHMHENPLLARANELFARITLGDFVELIVDHDDKEGAILVGRQRDRKLKRVDEMSSGTREQLFLALRIAAIERYVVTAGPMPIIFDDAFLESDDDRSEKIFESLAELAQLTQVIVLTHRSHQAELGERILGRRLAVIEMEGASPILKAAA